MVNGSAEVSMVVMRPCAAQTAVCFQPEGLICLQWLFPQEGGAAQGWVIRVTREVGDLHHWRFLGNGCWRCNKISAVVRNLKLNEQLL